MDFELRQAQRRFEEEQQRARERARRKAEKDKKLREDALARRAAEEEAQRLLRQEEAAKAEERQRQLEADLERGDGIALSRILQVVPIPGDGDKMTLPPSMLEDLPLDQALDRGPMFFEIIPLPPAAVQDPPQQGDREEGSTFAGVREFTAPPGCVGIPEHVLRNLRLKLPSPSTGVSRVRVRYVKLPKGKYAQLQVVGDGSHLSHLITDQKAELESHLRSFTTLSEGDTLELTRGSGTHKLALRVLQLKPGRAVSLIDTDLEVDILPPETSPNEGSTAKKGKSLKHKDTISVSRGEGKVTPLPLDKEARVSIGPGEWQLFKVSGLEGTGSSGTGTPALEVSTTWDWSLPREASNSLDSMDLDQNPLEIDLYASSPPVMHPSLLDHVASSSGLGPKTLVVPGDVVYQSGGHVIIGAHAFKGEGEFTLCVKRAVADVAEERQQGDGAASTSGGQVEAECSNCGRRLPERTLVLHEAYCRRNNAVCPVGTCQAVVLRTDLDKGLHKHCSICQELFPRQPQGGTGVGSVDESAHVAAAEAKHMAVHHTPLTCSCGVSHDLALMVQHRRKDCPHRWIVCRFCGSNVCAEGSPTSARDSLRGLSAHEASCGSRTTPCDTCRMNVMLKDMDVHVAAFHPLNGAHSPSILQQQNLQSPELPGNFTERSKKETWNTPEPQGEVSYHALPIASSGGLLPQVETSNSSHAMMNRSLNVECPVCGEKVHSERDLSHHFDLVH